MIVLASVGIGMAKASKNAAKTGRRATATAREAFKLIHPTVRSMHEDIAGGLEEARKEREDLQKKLSETVQEESSKILAGQSKMQSSILKTSKKERGEEGAAMRAWMLDNLKPASGASAAELSQAKEERDAQQERAVKAEADVDALTKAQKAAEAEHQSAVNKWRDQKRAACLDAKQKQSQKEAAEKALKQEQALREAAEWEAQKKAEEAERLAKALAKHRRALKEKRVLLSPDNVPASTSASSGGVDFVAKARADYDPAKDRRSKAEHLKENPLPSMDTYGRKAR